MKTDIQIGYRQAPPPSRLCGVYPYPQTHQGSVRLDQDVGGMRKTRLYSLNKVGCAFAFTATAYNLVRLPELLAVSP